MLNFIVWVILIYFALMLIWRYVVPFMLRVYMKRMEKRFRRYADEDTFNRNSKREGEVSIHHVPEQEEHIPPAGGDIEYTDFEEIKDDKTP
jgi:hypothetical protein